PFCPQCGAPQIRVRTETGTVPATAEDGTAATSLREPGANRLIWRAVLPKAAGSGLLMAALVMLAGTPLLLLFIPPLCAGLGVIWYSRREKTELTSGMGARLGAVTGCFGFIFQSIIFGVIFLSKPGEMKALFQKQIQEAIARSPN